MVVFLNMLPYLVMGVAIWIAYHAIKTRTWRLMLISIGIIIIFGFIQPGSLPKGDIKRSEIPEFTTSDVVIDDRGRKPIPKDEVRQERVDQIKTGPEFLTN